MTFDTVDSLKPTDKNNLTESVSLIVGLTLYNENFKIFNKRKKKMNNKAICVFFFFFQQKRLKLIHFETSRLQHVTDVNLTSCIN